MTPWLGLEISSLRSNFHYHQPLPTSSRLLQYSLEEFSQPQLSLTIRKTVSRKPFLGMGWCFILPWALLAVTYLWMYQIKLDIRQSAMTSDNYFSLINSRTDSLFTVTTTVYDSTATGWYGDSCAEAVVSSTSSSPILTSTDDPPTSKVTTSLPGQTSLPTESSLPWRRTEDTVIDKPSRSILEDYGLVSLHNMFESSWADQHKYVLKQVLDKVLDTMEVVWHIFRKVYHYPLDPP